LLLEDTELGASVKGLLAVLKSGVPSISQLSFRVLHRLANVISNKKKLRMIDYCDNEVRGGLEEQALAVLERKFAYEMEEWTIKGSDMIEQSHDDIETVYDGIIKHMLKDIECRSPEIELNDIMTSIPQK
jgi:hypothetical protein